MTGKNKLILIVGSSLISIAFMAVIYFVLILSGGIGLVNNTAIYISSASASKEYDGTELVCHDYRIDNELIDGDTIEVIFNGSQLNAGESDNTFDVIIRNEKGTDVTSSYKINKEFGKLIVTQRPITLKSLGAVKEFDNKPLVNHDFVILEGSLVEGDVIEPKFVNSITKIGSIVNTFTSTIYDSKYDNVTNNYKIAYEYDVLEVIPIQIRIDTESFSQIYNGETLSADSSSYKLIDSDKLSKYNFTIKVNASLTDVGLIENKPTLIVTDEYGNDVSQYFAVTGEFGVVEVTPFPITIKTGDAKKVYDGTPLTNDEYEIVTENIIGNPTISLKVIGSQLNVGVSENICSDIKCVVDGKDVTKNYTFVFVYGKLEVVEKLAIVSTGSLEKAYDSEPLVCSDWSISDDTPIIEGQKMLIKIDGYQLEVGESENTIESIIVLDKSGNDITFNYTFELVLGMLVVTESSGEGGSSIKPGGLQNDGKLLESGKISSEGGINGSNDVFNFLADGHEKIYFKYKSFGDYKIGYGWLNAVKYSNNSIVNNQAIVLENFGISSSTIEITYLVNTGQYLIPYFSKLDGDILSNANDVLINATAPMSYSLDFFYSKVIPSDYLNSISDYNDFVKAHYLSIPDSTKEAMLNYAQEAGIDINSPSLIDDIAKYVSQRASYNLEFEKFPDGVDQAVYFLSGDKEGICQHYATSATCMYRALGIPARYTVGYVKEANDGEIQTVTSDQAHAWVEVYIDDFGWIPVEVTGSSNNGSGESGGSGSGSGSGESGGGSGSGSGDGSGSESGGESGGSGSGDGSGGTGGSGSGSGSGESGGSGDGSGGTGGSGSGSGSGESGGESGGGSGSGSGSGGDSSEISKNPFDQLDGTVFKFVSNSSGTIYFKEKSYGDYHLSGFDKAYYYNGTEIPSFMVSSILDSFGLSESEITIIPNDTMSILIPYYITSNNVLEGLKDEIIDIQTSDEYVLYYINYDYLMFKYPLDSISKETTDYDNFVYENYLKLPEDTKASMLEIANRNGLDPNSDTIIEDIKSFIQKVKPYNLDFDPFPDGCDIAVYFLTEAESGICQHYATSATCMYRALGIPARYTVGFVSSSFADEEIKVSGKQAHAWVEIYLKGVGWVPIEVTGGSSSGGTGGSIDMGSGTQIVKLEAKVENVVFCSEDGNVTITASEYGNLIPTNDAFKSLVEKGYTFTIDFIGSQTGYGKSEINANPYSFKILDPEGNDVTQQYSLSVAPGVIKIYGKVLTINTPSMEKQYDGMPFIFNDSLVTHSDLIDAHEGAVVTLTPAVSDFHIGKYDNIYTIKVVVNGEDVTDFYKVVGNFGTLEIKPVSLTITSGSKTVKNNGEILTCDDYTVTGSLIEGDTIEVEMSGYQNGVGRSFNTISKVIIKNSQGEDVTSMYSLTLIAGTLVVLP